MPYHFVIVKSHVEAKPQGQVGSYSRKACAVSGFDRIVDIRPRGIYPVPPANHKAVGYHRKITYAEAHVYPAVHAGSRWLTPRVWENTNRAERRCVPSS